MKEFLEGFLDRLETKTEPNDGEYLSDDGLLYCAVYASVSRRKCAGRKRRRKPGNR